MGIKERRERVRQATRQGILDGARRIAQEEGWAGLTIRKVADSIEYSPSIVYEYFASKDEILLALMQEGFRELTAALKRAHDTTAEPRERLLRLGTAYMQFARANRDLYQVMHGLAGVSIDRAAREQAVQDVCMMAQAALEEWARADEIELNDPFGDTEILWSLLHGLTSLTIIDRIDGDEQRSQQLLERSLGLMLDGWKHAAT